MIIQKRKTRLFIFEISAAFVHLKLKSLHVHNMFNFSKQSMLNIYQNKRTFEQRSA